MAQNQVGQFSWTPRRKPVLPVSPALAPPDWRAFLTQPAGELSPENTGIWDLSGRGRGMGNVPRAIINYSPLPIIARGLESLGKAEHTAADWAFTSPGGKWVNQGEPASVPSAQANPVYVLPDAALGASTGAAGAAASLPSGDPMAKYQAAIKGMESAGNGDYAALGPIDPKSGDRAYGAYGVMGKNIPQWTQEALGKSMTPQEFLADKEAQDKVFNHRFGSYLSSGSEADAASRWFTGRPQSEGGSSNDVLGTTGNAYVNKFMHLLGLPGQPPTVEAYQQGTPPTIPDPVDRPAPTEPDFTAENAFLAQAAPQAADPALVKRLELQRVLSGLGAANANVDVRGPGGVGRLLAAWGAGVTGARATNASDALNRAQDLQTQERNFALQRARVAGDQSAAEVAWKNSVNDTSFENQSADQRASYDNTASQYDVTERNKSAGFDATQANRQNQYDYGEKLAQASKPHIVDTNAKGIVIQNPDGSHTMEPWDSVSGVTNFFKKSGLPGPLADIAKYDALAQYGDTDKYKMEIMKDIVASGSGQNVFGANYANALKIAQDSIDPALKNDAKIYQTSLTEAVTQQLWHDLLGNDGWIPNAAAMGNYGAKKMVPQRAQQ